MRYRRGSWYARNVPVILVSTLALLFFFSGGAGAFEALFVPNCSNASCHPATPTTCAGCHAHGTHSGSAKNDQNLTAQTDQASYSAGATVTVTLDGGYRGGWVRAYLYDNTGTLVDTSTGAGGLGGGAALPVALTGIAPAAPGTYTFTAAWYGNAYDAGGATFGANWTPDPANANHGQEKISTNSFTVTGAADNTSPTVSSTTPANNATGVAVNTTVTATFSEPIAPGTVDNTSFFLNNGTDNVAGTVSVADNTITFTPAAALSDNTAYTATVTTAVTDIAGNPLAADFVWSFTTAATPPPPAPPVAEDDNNFFGCTAAASGGRSSDIPIAYGFLILVGLGAAIRKRIKRSAGR
ncbi:MAG: fibronectin type protein [Deltaproteobacteria bacterium]|nr:fibronectin type protein [Deltaproteobacteria bacterium]